MSRMCRMGVLASVALALAVAGAGCGKTHDDDGGPGSDAGRDAAAADGAPRGDPDGGGDGGDGSVAVTRSLLIEPDQGMTPVYDLVKSATKSIDMTMYELTDTTMTGLLTTAAASGVSVRVILDQNLEKSANTPAYDALSATKVEVHWASPTYASTHQKTITVDGTTSAIMSLNLASDDYATSRDFAIVTNDPVDVAAIEETFGQDFASAPVTPSNGTDLVWSPTNAQSAILGLIASAKTSIILENEEMSDDDVVQALDLAGMHGIDLKIVMEGSKEWDDNFTLLASVGAKIATYGHGALYIHAKVILVDYGQPGAKLFVGSENFSNASLTENRELGTIVTDPSILSAMNTTLASDFAGGAAYP